MIRFFRHLFTNKVSIQKQFPKKVFSKIESLIRDSEEQHQAEICFTVEASLPLKKILNKTTSRERAIEVFSEQRIWDTEENSGVLLYLLLADRSIEIIADRGIIKLVSQSDWDKICKTIQTSFQAKLFEKGVIDGITEITLILKKNFPALGYPKNEISNKPIIL